MTARHVGVVITPHQFRHLAAKRFLAEFPGQYAVVAQLLGHASEETSRNSYRGTETDIALQRFDQLVATRRATLRRARPPAHRKAKSPIKGASSKEIG